MCTGPISGSLHIRKTDGTPITVPALTAPRRPGFENGTWYLFYGAETRRGWLATSRDLKTWTNVKDDPVLARGPDSYDATAVAVPNQVVKCGAYYYAFYHANAQRPWIDWNRRMSPARATLVQEMLGDSIPSRTLCEKN